MEIKTYDHRGLLRLGKIHIGKEYVDDQAGHCAQERQDTSKDEKLSV